MADIEPILRSQALAGGRVEPTGADRGTGSCSGQGQNDRPMK
jgi:hypothetical protein